MGCTGSKEAEPPKPIAHEKEEVVSVRPHVAQKGNYKVTLQQGKDYYWCACGLSKNQPFCDGSHQGTSFNPRQFKYEKETGEAYLCGCKHNKVESGPYCDNSHAQVDW